MSNLLSKLSGTPVNKPIEPREIFMSLPMKNKQYEYARDVQAEVWKKWYNIRNNKNAVIKMNTGSGKTVVGLMILQSCLNDQNGPAIYVVPDKYLAAQVCDEAKKLGILAVMDKDDYDYVENRAILVTPIQALVNGKSVFGMRPHNNYPIGSVLFDDVHACLDIIISQFSLKILSSHSLYNEVINLLSDSWKAYDKISYMNIVESQDPQKDVLIPFWIWQENQEAIYRLLKKYDNKDDKNQFIYFNLPLISEHLKSCSCIITARSIEITPKGIPIDLISSFDKAKRRIFMSATLADDSVFISSLGLKKEELLNIITPEKANDIGDRLILFPKHLNAILSDEEIRSKILSFTETYNVVVLVPSKEQGLLWDPTGDRIVTKETIEQTISDLKSKHVGLVIFLNRYDGIDLPDEACRILVIDGLPPLRSEYDKYVQSINPTSNTLLREQIQRIEQGMGRAVRSNSDYCCVVLMGNKLSDVLLRNNGVSYFSNATLEQYNLSKELWDLLKQEKPNPTLNDIFGLLDYSLTRQVEWIQKSRDRLSSVAYKTMPNIDDITIALREAFEYATIEEWAKAGEVIDNIINKETDVKTKGYLMQIKAEYTNFLDLSKSQQILKCARSLNRGTLTPINGIQYDKLINSKDQAKAIVEYFQTVSSSPNECLLYIKAALDELTFSPDADEFEIALEKIGNILGFESSRTDKDGGPDNLWAIGNNKYLVIECKSGTSTDTISKSYCNQLGGSIRWFKNEYGIECKCTPVMIHKSNVLDNLATPTDNMRIITPEKLEAFKSKIHEFTVAMTRNGTWNDESKINALLLSYKLRGQDIAQEYTTIAKTNRT